MVSTSSPRFYSRLPPKHAYPHPLTRNTKFKLHCTCPVTSLAALTTFGLFAVFGYWPFFLQILSFLVFHDTTSSWFYSFLSLFTHLFSFPFFLLSFLQQAFVFSFLLLSKDFTWRKNSFSCIQISNSWLLTWMYILPDTDFSLNTSPYTFHKKCSFVSKIKLLIVAQAHSLF